MDTGPGEPGPVKYTRSLLGLGALVDEFVVLKTRHHFSMFAEFPELLMDYLWMIYGIFMDYLWLFGSRFFFDSCSVEVPFGQRLASLPQRSRPFPHGFSCALAAVAQPPHSDFLDFLDRSPSNLRAPTCKVSCEWI